MSNLTLDNTILKEEILVQSTIYDCIDSGSSFHFLAGAGSGKTYALVESIKYHVAKRSSLFERTGKKIACITYTNAAKDEVIHRLYKSDNVAVSTIHTFLWSIIEPHQKELLDIHKENILNLIKRLENSLYHDLDKGNKPAYKKFRGLDDSERNEVILLIREDHSKFFNVFKSGKSTIFWDSLALALGDEYCSKLKSNRSDIERIIKDIIKLDKYNCCVSKMIEGGSGFKKIEYNEFGGREILHRNVIGHDTLVDYAWAMVKKYDLLRKIIIDKYPAVYVDEYQDTHEKVIFILDDLLRYSRENELNFLVSLFGDPMQSIYSNNLSLVSIKSDIGLVSKNINRRSSNDIISLINNIRGDHQSIKQKSIYTDANYGDVQLLCKPSELFDTEFIKLEIEDLKSSWNISDSNKLNCMVLKNKNLAELAGFVDLYDIINNIYSDKSNYLNYNSINEEFLNQDLSRLGRLPYAIYKVLKPLFYVKYLGYKSLSDVFGRETLKQCTLHDVSACLDSLRSREFKNIRDFVGFVFNKLSIDDGNYSPFNCFNIYKSKTFDDFKSRIIKEMSEEPSDKSVGYIDKILDLDLDIIENWLRFILLVERDSDVEFLTCHSSKGLEFDNVLVILNDQFGKKQSGKFEKKKFSSLLNSDLNSELDVDLEMTRNLLYVVCSRAKVNLKVIIFSDDLPQDFSAGHLCN